MKVNGSHKCLGIEQLGLSSKYLSLLSTQEKWWTVFLSLLWSPKIKDKSHESDAQAYFTRWTVKTKNQGRKDNINVSLILSKYRNLLHLFSPQVSTVANYNAISGVELICGTVAVFVSLSLVNPSIPSVSAMQYLQLQNFIEYW